MLCRHISDVAAGDGRLQLDFRDGVLRRFCNGINSFFDGEITPFRYFKTTSFHFFGINGHASVVWILPV